MLVKRIFFGTLRPIEIEVSVVGRQVRGRSLTFVRWNDACGMKHLYDKSWYFFTETMLALTMFR